MDTTIEIKENSSWLDRPVFRSFPQFKTETFFITLILILAIFSRFFMLGDRVMSHDEVNHVVPSYDLFTGAGYRHDPMTHGPFQFHAVSLSYFLFGDNDVAARTPAALFNIATVAFVLFAFRKYLGRVGALIAGFLFTISPYLLFYGRYTRNEAFVALYAVVMIYAVLRYLENGKVSSLYLLTIATAMHYVTKETSFIYSAQLLIFLAFLFMVRVANAHWPKKEARNTFLLTLSGALILIMLTLGLASWNAIANRGAEADASGALNGSLGWLKAAEGAGVIIAVVLAIIAIVILLKSIGWNALKQERSFDLLILTGTLILPQLTAFPIKMMGSLLGTNWDPLDYTQAGMIRASIFLVLTTGIAAVVGMLWRPKVWLKNFVVFYAIFTVFYTTFFTNGSGFFTGIIGSLGYWLSQQSVYRGEQPWYYYALLQVPIYEYLAAFGTALAVYFGSKYDRWSQVPSDRLMDSAGELLTQPVDEPTAPVQDDSSQTSPADGGEHEAALVVDREEPAIFTQGLRLPILSLLVFWSISAIFAYTFAGERMPWLTVHIAVPLLLTAGWGFGWLLESTPWKRFARNNSWIALLLLPIFITSLGGFLGTLLSANPPFQGNTLDQLQSTSIFIISAIALALSGWGILRLLHDWTSSEVLRIAVVGFSVVLAVLTMRTAATASYVKYDTAEEFLVFAHAARGPKDILAQVEEISRRTTGGLDISVAYDADANYPFWWYFRHFPNRRYFGNEPTRDLQDSPIIIAGDANWGKIDSLTRGGYVYYEYNRLWWPMQDYYNLTWERVWDALKKPEMRSALFQIWLNRDYTEYAAVSGRTDLTLSNWNPSEKLRMYIRKDVIAQIWNYGAAPEVPAQEETNPYLAGMIILSPDQIVGQSGSQPGQLNAPRDMGFAKDGSLYVADSRNNRIQQFSPDGKLVRSWGTFADVSKGDAAGGTFYEPWGLAVGPDGSVYVTDTWNHRIHKFSPEGEFIKMWGYFGQAEAPEAFWGPRDVAFDSHGLLYVTDTGNKRVVIFDVDGNYVAQFGTPGFDPGQFDEQVGIAINSKDEIFITDTWNQRIQVFSFDPQTQQASFIRYWDVSAWFGSSLENKPYITVDGQDHVFITDPEGYRVLEFTSDGQYVRGWGDYSPGSDGFGLPSGIEVDADGHVWVSDAGNNLILRFTLPAE